MENARYPGDVGTRLGRGVSGLAQATLLGLVIAFAGDAQAQTFSVIHSFTGGSDGASPEAGLSIDRAGHLYGTTAFGGAGFGTVFELKQMGSGWALNPLYIFQGGNDGVQPIARVIIGPNGTLYGTTAHGGGTGCGGTGCGIIFNLRPPVSACTSAICPWTESVLYRFGGGTDGGVPLGDLLFDQAGNIYGATLEGGMTPCGGYGCGTVYKLTHSGSGWTEDVLYRFTNGADGGFPAGGVVSDPSGNLYGATTNGGSSDLGTVFKLTHSGSGWTESVIYSFQGGTDGSNPQTGVILDVSGNLYGTTYAGGMESGGTVFRLTPSGGSWTLTAFYDFSGGFGSGGPYRGELMMDAGGNLYGTTLHDVGGPGAAFELMPSGDSWTYISLHDFQGGQDGEYPSCNLVFDTSGNLYGTAPLRGSHNAGVVFKIAP